MKILYVSQYFPPEIGAPAARISELSQAWAARGHQVSVLTGFPNHPTGKVPDEYRGKLRRLFMRDDRDGYRVYRTFLFPLPNRKSWERMLNYASFALSAALRGMFVPRPDVVIATSPQLLVGLAGYWTSLAKRVPFIFEVRDLWPESLEAVGVSRGRSLMMRILSGVARLLYSRADHIVVVTLPFKQHISQVWGVAPEKISLVRNGVDHELFSPDVDGFAERHLLGLAGKFVVAFIGTIGNAHKLGTLLEAAKLLRHRDDIAFLVVGEGAEKEAFEKAVRSEMLPNFHIHGEHRRASVPQLIRSADVGVVLLRKAELFKKVVPTKMLEYLSCGLPVIVGVEGRSSEIVTEAGAGICIEPENAQQLAEAILRMKSDPEFRRKCSANSRQYILANFVRADTADRYLEVIQNVIGKQSQPSRLAALPRVRE